MSDLRVVGPDDVPQTVAFAADRAPWDRQPYESRQAFEAFTTYRDLGSERSTAAVARSLGKSKTLTDRWCSRWRWVARVDAYLADQDRIRLEANASAIADMSRRHIEEAMTIQRAAMMPALELVRRVDAGELELEKMDALDLLRLSRIMAYAHAAAGRFERLARGVSDAAGALEDPLEEHRERIAEIQGEAIVQVIVLVVGSAELGLTDEQREIAKRLAATHLRQLAS